MDIYSKAFELFWEIYNSNIDFKNLIDSNMKNGKVRFFDDNEFNKIKKQNFMSPIPQMNEFIDMFVLGYNIGNCAGTARQLSYSYNDVDIVSGILPSLKGTLNAEKEGGHVWLENQNYIIDTSLMLVIDLSLKDDFGYIEEQRLTSLQLTSSPNYMSRKEFVNDASLRK